MNNSPSLRPPAPTPGIDYLTIEQHGFHEARLEKHRAEINALRLPGLLQAAAIVFTESPNVAYAVSMAFELEAMIKSTLNGTHRQYNGSTEAGRGSPLNSLP